MPTSLGVVEAKQGAWLPDVSQLTQYAATVAASGVRLGTITTLSDTPLAFAASLLPSQLLGLPVRHLTWRGVRGLAAESEKMENQSARRVLRDLQRFIGGLIGMDTVYSNRVFVVSLGAGCPEGWSISWIDIVARYNRYFYPVAKNWPAPPNYLAFRYEGQLQSIHHVVRYEIFTDPHAAFPEVPHATSGQHYLFTLGPPIRPSHKVTNGPRIQMSNRCWCMLDTLLSAPTISDALTETEARIESWNRERAV